MAVTAPHLGEIVRKADLLISDMIGEQPARGTSPFEREFEELARELSGEATDHDPDANLVWVTDPYVKQATVWIKYLLHVDAPRCERDPPAYGAEILLCAEAVKKLLSKINLNNASRKRRHIPLVMVELEQAIDTLRAVRISTP
jgi:hypothetical protein